MRLRGSADLLEDRRRRALALVDEGLSLHEVGRRIRCSASSVKRWRDARRKGGQQALKVRVSPGRPLRLSRVDTLVSGLPAALQQIDVASGSAADYDAWLLGGVA